MSGDIPSIDRLLPHAAPMILLDELIEFDAGGHARCRVTIRPDSPFVEDGRVRAVVAMEYMAQAVAAYVGMRGHRRGEQPSIGFLLGSRELKLFVDTLHAGDTLLVHVEHLFGDAQMGSFRTSVQRGDERIAEAVLNVYQYTGKEPLP